MDGTLIVTKTRKKFPVEEYDFLYINDRVIEKLRKLNSRGYSINKCNSIIKDIGIDIIILVSTSKDEFRKPGIEFYTYLNTLYPKIIKSFFVGDVCLFRYEICSKL